MSDISLSFPLWMIAWFLLGEATPLITLVLISLSAAFFFNRNAGRIRRAYWLKWTLAIVGGLWLGGISFWAAGLVDQIRTDIYQAQHHYRLDKAAVLAGIEIPKHSWVSIDEEGRLSPTRPTTSKRPVKMPIGGTYDTYGAYGTYGSYAPYDYGYYGYLPYGGYGSYYGGHREFGHGFGHTGIGAEGTVAHHGMGFRSIGVAHVGSDGFADRGVNVAHLGRGGFAHGMGVAHVGGFGHSIGGGFGHGIAGGFHGGGGGHR